MTVPAPDEVASRLVLHLMERTDRPHDLATAYERTMGWSYPHPSVGVPKFEAAVGLLLGNGIAVTTIHVIEPTARIYDIIEAIVLETGGWLRWYTEVGFEIWDGDDNPTAPEDVHGGSLEAAIVARCTQPSVPWTMPPGVKIARRTFLESVSTPLGVALFGAVATVVGPFVVLGGILWSPVGAVWHVIERARGKR